MLQGRDPGGFREALTGRENRGARSTDRAPLNPADRTAPNPADRTPCTRWTGPAHVDPQGPLTPLSPLSTLHPAASPVSPASPASQVSRAS
ncbi:hypothetical protein GCM10010326_14240 [Streptomyces xanthochromogenes]|uniref:Uncharacterized protein n=1 Tax=Streptomyces xanthochromogenes TaxID=67384 RepID=A0ABQ2ZQ13_9ACTN|nr:hypothetical protein GCM10010326_14240 [Streptomyces xanthochromogenes]